MDQFVRQHQKPAPTHKRPTVVNLFVENISFDSLVIKFDVCVARQKLKWQLIKSPHPENTTLERILNQKMSTDSTPQRDSHPAPANGPSSSLEMFGGKDGKLMLPSMSLSSQTNTNSLLGLASTLFHSSAAEGQSPLSAVPVRRQYCKWK